MLRCIIYELKKIKIEKFLFLLIAVLIAGNVGISFLYHEESFKFNEALLNERNAYLEAKESILGEDEIGIKQTCDKEIAIIEYCLENSVPYKQVTVISNLIYNRYFISIIMIFLVLIIYNIVSVEDENDTWKNLVIANRKQFRRIFYRKRFSSYLAIFLVLFFYIGVAFLFGCIRYGNWTNIYLSYCNEKVVVGNYNEQLIEMVASVTVQSVLYSAVAFLSAMIIKRSRIGVATVIVLILFEEKVTSLLEHFEMAYLFPFYHLHVLGNVYNYNMENVLIALIYVLILVSVMEILSYRFMIKKCI